MIFIAGVLTFALVLISLGLILLVLVQLPKKDAGAGLAFGSGAADALFGAGSGNALTKITKWGTVAFIVVAVLLGIMEDHLHSNGSNPSEFMKKVGESQMQQTSPAAPSGTAPAVPSANNDSVAPLKLTTNAAPAASGK